MKTKCTNCETEFETKFETKKYCSTNCKQEHFYKRKFNIDNVTTTSPPTSHEQRIESTDSIDNNKRISSTNIVNPIRSGAETPDGYLHKYIEAIQLNCQLQSKLDIANFMLEQRNEEEEEEEEEEENELTNEEQIKFYKSLNGILPIALNKFLSNGKTEKPV